jgi:hypothetical protein
VAGVTRVGGEPGLVLAFAGFERAGTIHGGHQALVWNSGSRGHVVSLHVAEGVAADRRRAMLDAVDASMTPG